MNPSSVRIEFLGAVPELRITLPRQSDPDPVWALLANEEVVVSGAHAVTTELRVLMHAKLFDRSGRPLSPQRAANLLRRFGANRGGTATSDLPA